MNEKEQYRALGDLTKNKEKWQEGLNWSFRICRSCKNSQRKTPTLLSEFTVPVLPGLQIAN